MPIQKRWSPFTVERLKLVPNVCGIYELGDINGEIVYIGSGDSIHGIKGRLGYHKKHKPKSVKYFRFLEVGFWGNPLALEQEHCEIFEYRYGRLPALQKRMPRGFVSWW